MLILVFNFSTIIIFPRVGFEFCEDIFDHVPLNPFILFVMLIQWFVKESAVFGLV